MRNRVRTAALGGVIGPAGFISGWVIGAATPLLAARPLLAMGHQRLARFGIAAGLTSLIALALTTTGLPTGLFQRVGLTASDAWVIATAVTMIRGFR